MIMLNDSNRLAGLDVLRIVAVAGVMMAHYFWSKEWINDKFGADPEIVFGDIAHIAAYGFLGVHLFFIISGTVISRSVIRRSAREFVIARFLRLMPALLIAVVFSAAVLLIGGDLFIERALRSIPTNLMLMPLIADTGWLNPVFWTLAIEASFYAIVGLIVFIWGSSRLVLWRLAWIWLGFTIVLSNAGELNNQSVALVGWGPFFIIGIMIGAAQSISDRVLAAIGIVAANLLAIQTTLSTMDPEGRPIDFIFACIFVMSIAVALVVWIRPLAATQSKGLAFAGTMTYSIYLFHVIPGRMFAEYLLGEGWRTVDAYLLSVLSTFILSYLVTKFAEPVLRRWFISALIK